MRFRCRRSFVVALGLLLCLPLVAPAGATCVGGAPNGVLDPGEACDDGNLVETDGCCNDCTDVSCAPAGGRRGGDRVARPAAEAGGGSKGRRPARAGGRRAPLWASPRCSPLKKPLAPPQTPFPTPSPPSRSAPRRSRSSRRPPVHSSSG